MIKLYELTCLISPQISEQELKFLGEKINSLIKKEKGNLAETDVPIKKKDEVFIATFNFYLSPENLINLEKKLKPETKILRYLLLTKKQPKKVEIPNRPKSGKIAKPKQKKVELKDIEKKLEEILGE